LDFWGQLPKNIFGGIIKLRINYSMKNTSNDFKVIHLSTGHSGGAGLAARRLNSSLNLMHVNSTFMSLAKRDFIEQLNEKAIRRSMLRKVISFAYLRIQNNFSNITLFSTFSTNSKSYRYFKRLGSDSKTILHFHNWANLISEEKLIKLSNDGINILITAHDERFITGGCHYKFSCEQIIYNCNKCPLVSKNWQKKAIRNKKLKKHLLISSINNQPVIVTPSKWLNREFKKVQIVSDEKIFFIPNTLGPNWNAENYKYKSSKSKKKFLVGIASMDPYSFIKGGDIVSSIIESPEIKKNGFTFCFLNQVILSEQFEKFWKKIDLLLVLSRADNSPNVIWEACSLEIPVVTAKIGGITEIAKIHNIHLLNRPEQAKKAFMSSDNESVKYYLQTYGESKTSLSKTTKNAEENYLKLYLNILNQDLKGENK